MFKPAKRYALISNRLLRLGLSLSIMLMAGVASSKPDSITETEMKLLPHYCPDTQGFKYGYNSPRAGHWIAIMGNGFWAVHHYCWGLINLQRASRHNISPQSKKSLLTSVLDDFRYVVFNTPPDFILLPEIYTRIGEVELRMSQPDKANEAFTRARELKPDYWPAYSHWAEFLFKNGQRSNALKIVSLGLQHSPNAKVLLELYRVISGSKYDGLKPVEKPTNEITLPVESESFMPNKLPEPGANSSKREGA